MAAEPNNEGGRRSADGRVAVGHPIDVASGTLFHDFEDRALPGRMPLVFGRRYSSALSNRAAEAPAGMFGPGWASPFEMRILRDLEGYRMVTEDGEGEVAFDDFAGLVDAGETVRNLGAFHELRREGDRLVVTRWDPGTGEVVRFFFAVGAEGAWWPLVSRRYVDGHGVDVERDRGGRITALRQRRERRGFRLAYDGAGRLAEVYLVAPAAAWEGAWGNGREGYAPQDLQRWRGERPLLRYRYDERGLLAQFTDALGQSAHYEYGAAGRMTREVTLGGMVYVFGYDADGRCIHTTGEDGYGRNDLAFAPLAHETRVTDSLGHTTTYRWNDDGQVEAETSPLGHTKTTAYDAYGRIVQRVSPGGATTSYAYDDRGDRVSVAEPDGAVTAYAFDEQHQAIRVTDPLGYQTHRTIEAGRVVAVTNALGHAYTYAYSPAGDLVAITNPKGDTRRLEWNGSGDLAGQTDYRGNRTAYESSPEGALTAATDAAGFRTEALLDAGGRVREARLSDGARRRYAWNAYDQLTSFTDERGFITEIHYAPAGVITELARPYGGRVRFEWGTIPGQLLTILNERGERYTFDYDADDRATREVDFGGRATRYELDPDGRVERVEDNAGHVSTIGRDAASRVAEVLHDDGSQTSFEYDLRGFVTRADNGQCVVERRYDALGRVVLEIQDGHEVGSEYDEVGNRVARHSSLGPEVRFAWDPNGQLSRLLPRAHRAIEFTYDGRLNEVRRGVEGGVQIEHVYDGRGRVVEQSVFGVAKGSRHVAVGVEPTVHREYRYDAASNLTQLIDTRWGATQYAYDHLDRIVAAQVAQGLSEHFAYDATDNLVEVGRAPTLEQATAHAEPVRYGPGSTLLRRGSVEYEHDALGQRIRKTGPEGTTHYRWNQSGQLMEVERPDGSVWRYRYDAFGRRVEKRGPSTRATFVWDGDVVLHEVHGNGVGQLQRADWEYEPYGFAPLSKIDQEQQYLAVNNVNGAPRELVREDGGVVWAARRNSLGELDRGDISEVDCMIGLQGQWVEPETGLSYNRYRYYDPELMRFISKDPYKFYHNFNAFAFTKSTTTWVDPLGLTGSCPRTRVVAGVTVTDQRTGQTMTGNVDLGPTIERIDSGGSFPHRNDGSTFGNREGRLPAHPAGYYTEYVHPTPGVSGPGPQRIVVGSGGEWYYTPDHYGTFIRLN